MIETKLKILHLLSQRPDSTGSGYYIQAMLKESEENEHDNFLLAGLHSKDIPDIEVIPKDKREFIHFNGHDISYQIVGMSDVMPYESKKFCDLSNEEIDEYEAVFKAKIEKIISEYKPDIIHSHHLWILTSLVRRNFPQIPVVASCHGSDIRQFRKCDHLRERVLSGCRDLEGVMALSENQKNEIIELYGHSADKVHVVGAGFNDEIFTFSEKPKPDPVQIIYAGKLSRSKGVPWMLKAFAEIKDPNWKLHLVGSGSGKEKKECIELANGLGDKVVIHGAVHQNELAGIMKRSHIFILPSFYEGLPLVVLEALASGCRIIATDLPGIKEISKHIDKQNLKIIKTPRLHSVDSPVAEDEDGFVKDLKSVIESSIVEITESPIVKEEGINLFTWSSVFDKVQEVYKKCLKPENHIKKAYFAGGCFWGVEYYMEKIEGVIDVVSGYMGGHIDNPSYRDITTGTTGHYESVEVIYDDRKTDFEALAREFFEIHDPTQANGQGPDIGEQYKSVVFYSNDKEKIVTEKLIDILRSKGYKVATIIKQIAEFYDAEDYHQNYYDNKGSLPYCHSKEKRF